MTPQRVVIAGAGSLGRELRTYLAHTGIPAAQIVFLDDTQLARLDLPVIGKISEASFLLNPITDALCVAIADPAGRASVFDQLAAHHPCGVTHPDSRGGDVWPPSHGLMMMPFSLISADAQIGRGALLNTYASVGHDVRIGDFVTLCSHVTVCGRAKVGDFAFLGTGAIIAPDVSIGARAFIGAGSVVINDVPAGARVFGNPARAFK